MKSEDVNGTVGSDETQLYSSLLHLEELESLLEDLEEHSVRAETEELPEELRERLRKLGLSGPADIRRHIANLHSRLDAEA